MPKAKEFTIGVYRPGQHMLAAEAKIDLPASATELLDLFHRARINNERDIYSMELLACKREFLRKPLENQTLNVYGLNYLAWRLAGLEEYENGIFEGLCKMGPGPSITDLINMTFSMRDCAAMWDVCNDADLGKQSFEDDFFPELVDIPDEAAKFLDYAALGKTRREAERGVYTPNGYVVNLNWPNLRDHVKPDTLLEAPLPGAGLTVRFASATGQDAPVARKTAYGMPVNEPYVDVDLPISEKELDNVKVRLKCSAEDLRVSPEDSLVPSMMPYIRPDEDIGELNEFALCAKALHDMGQLSLYKAILATTACTTICHANTCAAEIGQYRLEPEVAGPEDYGREFLVEKVGAEHIGTFDRTSFWCLGTKLMKEQNIRETDYGLLCRKDGEPILTMAERENEPVLENSAGFLVPEGGQTAVPVDASSDEQADNMQTFEQTM